MNFYLRIYHALLLITLSWSGTVFCATEQPLRIAVASNFTPVLKKLLVEFHQKTKINTQIISGATGALFLQIKYGAPFDIFIAADSIRPAQLEQENLILANSRKTYAFGQLALLSMSSLEQPINSTEQHNKQSHEEPNNLKAQLEKSPTKFGIANPKIAPYGKAAKQTLEHLGLWHQYKPKLIQGININQTFAQIRSQAINSGLVANSQLVLNNLTGIIIPTNYHLPIKQQLVIINSSKKLNKAKRLSDYLLSTKVQNKIINFGYASFDVSTKDQT
ncbi:MAG: molybdate ABC transporter substrate-binding protein [Colwellia sp.]